MKPDSFRFGHGSLALFALLSAADLGLTFWLLNGGSGQLYESNPLAAWFLAEFGWFGLIGFKVVSVLLALTALTVLARCRPRVAGRVLWLGCLVLAFVVAYSGVLAGVVQPRLRVAEHTELSHQAARGKALDRRLNLLSDYRNEIRRLAEETARGTVSLQEAVEQLEAHPFVIDPLWEVRRRFEHPQLGGRDYLARLIEDHVRDNGLMALGQPPAGGSPTAGPSEKGPRRLHLCFR